MNGPKNNDKKLRRLVEAIEIDALEEMERRTIGKRVVLILTQAACRARRTLEKSLTVVFGLVTTRGPQTHSGVVFWSLKSVLYPTPGGPGVCRRTGAPHRGGAVRAGYGPFRAIRLSWRRAGLSRRWAAPAGWVCRPADPRAIAGSGVAVVVRSLSSRSARLGSTGGGGPPRHR